MRTLTFSCRGGECGNPIFRQVWIWDSHSQKWELGVLQDSYNFRAQLQRSKHLTLKCSLYRWKGLEVYVSKIASHEPFRHLQHKLWSKEGPEVKLAIWLLTTKSWESTRSRCVKMRVWHTIGKLLRRATSLLQTLSQSEVGAGSYEFPNSQESKPGLLLGSPKNKSHLDVGVAKKRKKYYMGEGGGFPRIRAVVSKMSQCCPWFVPTPRVFPKMN
jgi:hypothetical protein